MVIVLASQWIKIGGDPGHGGNDSGAVGRVKGTQEDNVNLSVSLAYMTAETQKGRVPILTRTTDVFVPLEKRAEILNKNNVALAVSFHCNSSPTAKPHYFSIWIYKLGGESEKLARCIQKRILAVTGWKDGGIRVNPKLLVTRATKMPCCLVENGFISNAEQEMQLINPVFRQKLGQAISDGVSDYLKAKGVVTR